MNTHKQVLLMSALLMVTLIIIGIYAAWYPSRSANATTAFQSDTAERGAILFARNCRLCHGDVAQGGAAGSRLPAAPPLDRSDLQGFIDSNATMKSDLTATGTTFTVSDGTKFKSGQTILLDEERLGITKIDGNTLTVKRALDPTTAASHLSGSAISTLDAATLADKVNLITNTITCGRVGTAMPAWGQTQGGPLSDEQIRQLMTLITTGHWELVAAEDNVEDAILSKLVEPMSATTISMKVTDVTVFNKGDAIRIGDERLRVDAVPVLPKDKNNNVVGSKDGIIQVQRGILNTSASDHDITTPIYKFPETSAPAINGASCGQTARPAAPPGTPTTIDNFTGQEVEVTAQNITFDTKSITVKSGGQVRLRLNNKDDGVDHDIAVYKSATDLTAVSTGSVSITFPGVATNDIAFAVPAAGTYYFRCDVHPTLMFGTFTVTP